MPGAAAQIAAASQQLVLRKFFKGVSRVGC
jgi:hypothetical protein